jgi:hypothetical protein
MTVRPGLARGYLSTDPASIVASAGRQAGGDLPTPLPRRGRVLEAAIGELEPAVELGLDLGDAVLCVRIRRLTGCLGERLALEQPGGLLGHSGGLAGEAFRLLGRRGGSRQEQQHRHQRGPDRATRDVPPSAAIKETEDGQPDASTRNDEAHDWTVVSTVSLTLRNGRLPGGKVFRSESRRLVQDARAAVLRRRPSRQQLVRWGLRDGFRALRRNRLCVMAARHAGSDLRDR